MRPQILVRRRNVESPVAPNFGGPNASFAVSRIFAENCKPVVRLKQSRLDGFDGDVNH